MKEVDGEDPVAGSSSSVYVGDQIYSRENTFGAHSLCVFDLLDLSICITRLLTTDNTTEALPGPADRPGYKLKVAWMMVQDLFGDCVVNLWAKPNKRAAGRLIVNIRMKFSEERYHWLYFFILVTPEELRRFGEELKAAHDRFEDWLQNSPSSERD